MLEGQLEIITGMWNSEGPLDIIGAHYRVEHCPALRKPLQKQLPVIIGGTGMRRTPALAARFAHESNAAFEPVPRAAFARVRSGCERIGRDPKSLRYSLARTAIVGATVAEQRRPARELCGDARLPSGLTARPLR